MLAPCAERVGTACVMARSMSGRALPGDEVEDAHAVGDVGLAASDRFGLGAARRPDDDQPGARPRAGLVAERAGAHKQALGVKVVDISLMLLADLVHARGELGRW